MFAANFLRTFPVPPNSSVYLLHVTETPTLAGFPKAYDMPDFEQQIATMRINLRKKAAEYLSKVQRLYQSHGISLHKIVKEGIPGAEILNFIDAEHIELVVMGTRGMSNLKTFLLGSVSEWVLTDAPCSVLIVREVRGRRKASRKGMHVLLATDGSEDAQAAAVFVRRLKPPSASVLTLVHVAEQYHNHIVRRLRTLGRNDALTIANDLVRVRQDRGTKLLGQTSQMFRTHGWLVRERLLVGHPADQILKSCTKVRPDLIVLGSRGLTAMRRFFLGSVSHKVARNAPASVLVVRSSKR